MAQKIRTVPFLVATKLLRARNGKKEHQSSEEQLTVFLHSISTHNMGNHCTAIREQGL